MKHDDAKAAVAAPTLNREAWLNALAVKLVPLFDRAGYKLDLSKVRLSCGFPDRGVRKVIGQCWRRDASASGHTEIFVSPILGKAKDVDHVLVHELVHHVVYPVRGHGAAFRKCAVGVGLAGKMTATHAGDELRALLNDLSESLGAFPHAALKLGANQKKQSTRLVKLECPGCGYIVRTTRKWLEQGVPSCSCGETFKLGE